MLAGNEREALLAVADRLSAELGYEGDREIPAELPGAAGSNGARVGILAAEDEALVASLRRALGRIAVALAEGRESDAPRPSVVAALDGAEMVMRGELMMGNASQLPALVPAFVFLVALSVVSQDEALELSNRTTSLLEAALGSDRSLGGEFDRDSIRPLASDEREGIDG